MRLLKLPGFSSFEVCLLADIGTQLPSDRADKSLLHDERHVEKSDQLPLSLKPISPNH